MDAAESRVSKAGQELAKLGAEKGGQARANVLSPEQRSEIARNAVRARWLKAGKLKQTESKAGVFTSPAPKPAPVPPKDAQPHSLLPGTLHIGSVSLECHVLSDGRRVFTQSEVVRVLTGGRDSGNLSRYLERIPLKNKALLEGPTIRFRAGNNQAIGYEATLLIEICEKYLEARALGLLKESQLKLAKQSEIIVRACAKVGIIALIDEATGYQKFRAKQALQLKLQAFIADELQDWARQFPQEFWVELARLEGVHYSPRNRPLRWGRYIMAFVYDAIDPDVGKLLREKNPNPHFRKNHHQWLKQFGKEKLHDQIIRVVTIMKSCDNMDSFRKRFARVFAKGPVQLTFNDAFGLDE